MELKVDPRIDMQILPRILDAGEAVVIGGQTELGCASTPRLLGNGL